MKMNIRQLESAEICYTSHPHKYMHTVWKTTWQYVIVFYS